MPGDNPPCPQKWLNEGFSKHQWLAAGAEQANLALPGHDRADVGDRYACCRRLLPQRVDFADRDRGQYFVIVPPVTNGFDQRGHIRNRRTCRLRERYPINLDLRSNDRRATELGEIAREAIGDVHGGRAMCRQYLCDCVARLRHQIAGLEAILLVARKPPTFSLFRRAPQGESQRSVADGAGHQDALPRCRAGAAHHPAVRYSAERGNRDHNRSRRANSVAAEQRAAKMLRVGGQTACKRTEPGVSDLLRQGQREQEPKRARALCGKIG